MEKMQNICNNLEEGKVLEKFISSCEEILITAARDLAVLTNYDIKANFIVNLSQECERLQKICTAPYKESKKQKIIREACRQLLIGIGNICHRAKQIQDKPLRHDVYDKFSLKMNYWWQRLACVY